MLTLTGQDLGRRLSSAPVDVLLTRICGEYQEMPDLGLTAAGPAALAVGRAHVPPTVWGCWSIGSS